MGMKSYVLMIVPFNEKIKDCLVYSSDYYDGVVNGIDVVATFFHCETSSVSRELANVMNVDPWDFMHSIDIDSISRSHLWNFYMEYFEDDLGPETYEKFLKCTKIAKTIMFMPNG